MRHTVREELRGILIFVGVIWAVFVVSLVFPDLNRLGLIPRTFRGLIGIAAMPFLHANVQHLIGNTVPLVVLLALLAGSRARSWETVLEIALLGGALLWAFGRSAVHVGASGLIFGLAVFLVVSGFLEKRLIPILIALVVAFLYGGSILSGMIPRFGSEVSWDGHLYGALAGATVAWFLTRSGPSENEQSPTCPTTSKS